MARRTSPWCALRPALLAGAAAAMWLALSSTAASADAGPDSQSLTPSAPGTVLSLPHNLAESVSPPPASPPAAVDPVPGLAQPVASRLSGLADAATSGVPVLEQVVPPGTVSSISAPVADVADAVTAGVVQVVAAPAAEAVPVLDPVLQPVSNVLTGATPVDLPALTADAPPAALPALGSGDPEVTRPAPVKAPVSALEAASDPALTSAAVPAEVGIGNDVRLQPAGAGAIADTLGPEEAQSASTDPGFGQPAGDPAQLPGQVPAAPASGTGSGGSSGGPSGAAAWVSGFNVVFELPGALLAGEASGHIPAPVSFDPGSSPD
ncbi:hypothetical protein [Pseudarthrobacter sp. fls2-241-R2A-127]|uniref:hypothetical protein n=1 Tax=Pseudarthrobacter sp. fls2-241-R2A-127 TaxID=3040303 RepID=UPI002556320A|nr:hypothetical protein [Pseudarthrobacter sp. fls2-241-R2A-127]